MRRNWPALKHGRSREIETGAHPRRRPSASTTVLVREAGDHYRLPESRREDRMMNRTWRTIGVSAFVMLAVLGTGWALEKASSGSRTQGTAAVSGPVKTSDRVTTPG